MSATTALQWVTGGAYLALFLACVWAGRRASLRAARRLKTIAIA